MSTTKPFYPHDSDSRIMMKKDRAEVENWVDDLEYVNEELEYLLDIEDKLVNSPRLYEQMQVAQKENKLRAKELKRYANIMENTLECDTVECDAHYLSKHEKNRNVYVDHVKKYRDLKTKVLSKILLNAKK